VGRAAHSSTIRKSRILLHVPIPAVILDGGSGSRLPTRLAITAGTYDGVLAGWDTVAYKRDDEKDDEKDDEDKNENTDLLAMLNKTAPQDENAYLKMNFAMAVHDGSVRTISMSSAHDHGHNHKNSKEEKTNRPSDDSKKSKSNTCIPGTLLSAGFDDNIAIFSLTKHTQNGDLKTPSNMGTPTCSGFAPPSDPAPSHALMGLSTGKIIIYTRKDMTVQHILSGHDDKGVTCLSVHPSGKMALSGGRDGKICLWDLMRGRLAFVSKIKNPKKGRKATVNDIVWSKDGARFAYCTHEGNITAREMESGQDLLDITMPLIGRANQVCFVGGDDGLFLAAACNDGGLPVFAVGSIDDEDEDAGTRRAIMAIEPLEGVATAGDERFKCIQSVEGGSSFLVVTANSGGIISLIDLEGAAQMMLSEEDEVGDGSDDGNKEGSSDEEDSIASDSDEEEDTAAEILESVRIGTGARITCISVWSSNEAVDGDAELEADSDEEIPEEEEAATEKEIEEDVLHTKKRKAEDIDVPENKKQEENEIELDPEALEKARALVSQTKKRQKKKKDKKKKKEKKNQ